VASPQPQSVYKYFDLADRFVRVQRLDPRGDALRASEELDRRGYRHALIAACIEELAGDLPAHLEELHPQDPFAAEDLLYQLCVAVNPELDIHRVSLRAEPEAAPAAPPRDAGDDYHARLARRAAGLERRLGRAVFGQDEAIATVSAAVGKAAAGLSEEHRPLGSMLFVGRTGTGKTELARQLARELFGEGRGFVRLDCSEYALAHEAARLVGAPPGYVGHEEGGQLTEALARDPECVVLFDEIEKAHPRMHHLLLQVLEDGKLADGKGNTASFDRAFVILTSNAGARDVVAASSPLGFGGESGPLDEGAVGAITESALADAFAPEFLARIDDTVVFRDLDEGDARRVATRLLSELASRARQRGTRVAFTPAVARWVASSGFSAASGARELRRVVRRCVEAPLARILLAPEREEGALLRVSISRGAPVFAWEE
jgi:ATP-dependent Clp protease ATP-binding subunit ClpC